MVFVQVEYLDYRRAGAIEFVLLGLAAFRNPIYYEYVIGSRQVCRFVV